MTRPPVLFLDEPTTGLDPTSRQRMWGVIRELVADGTTLLLTTQYLDEADVLADAISVIDHGTVIAQGTAGELKARVGGEQLEVTLAAAHAAAAGALAPLVAGRGAGERRRAPAHRARRAARGLATAVVRALDDAGVGRRRHRGPPPVARRRVLRPHRPPRGRPPPTPPTTIPHPPAHLLEV